MKDYIYIYQELFLNKISTEQICKQWVKEDFWIKWYEIDLLEIENKKLHENGLSAERDKSTYISDNFYLSTLQVLSSIMNGFKLPESFTKRVIIDYLADKYLNKGNNCNKLKIYDLDKIIHKQYQYPK
jgi:hypothetical protein